MRKHAEEIKEIFEEHDFDATTKSALVRFFEFSADKYDGLRRDFKVLLKAVAVAIVILAVGCASGIYVIRSEASKRADIFCRFTVVRYNDIVDRYNATVEYLNTPEGKLKTPINDIIRQRSFPALKDQVAAEGKAIPAGCLEDYDKRELKK